MRGTHEPLLPNLRCLTHNRAIGGRPFNFPSLDQRLDFDLDAWYGQGVFGEHAPVLAWPDPNPEVVRWEKTRWVYDAGSSFAGRVVITLPGSSKESVCTRFAYVQPLSVNACPHTIHVIVQSGLVKLLVILYSECTLRSNNARYEDRRKRDAPLVRR